MATQTVTVLFTDLVGSTELLSRFGDAVADELRREHFSLLRAVVAEAGGHEIKSTGDGLMVVFSGVGAGLACAVGMQQAIAARPASTAPLTMRVGLAVGEAAEEDGDWYGRSVVEAARLCALCEGGTILTTDMVRLLSRSRGGFEFESVGDVTLKGLDEPVTIHRVLWKPRAADDGNILPLPRRVASLAAARYVGRLREQEMLDAALKDACAGERRAVLVSGEPGIGKTTLAARVAERASKAGVSVLYGRCDEDLFVPYQPWAEALGHLVEQATPDLLRAHSATYGTVVGRVVPAVWASTVVQAADDRGAEEAERPRFFAAVVDLLARASAAAPLVVLLDDLQWADAGTLDLLRHVLLSDRVLSLLVVGTFRDADVGAEDPLAVLLAALHREQGVVRLPLRGLGDDELLAFLELIAGHEMNEDGLVLRDALAAETDGNPFFVRELLRHLAATGLIYQDAGGRWTTTDDLRTAGLPVSIREVVGQRVRSLGPQTHRVLTLASVIGRDFDLDLLERVAGADGVNLLDLCEAAVDVQLLREREGGDGYTFSHALIGHTLYDDLSAARRSRAHRAVAEALEELTGGDPGPRVGELAYHWAHASRHGDNAKAVAYAGEAGARALAVLAPAEAVRWYTQAIDLLGDEGGADATRAELLVGLGDAQRQAGLSAFRETLLHAAALAERLGDVHLLARAALTNNRGWQSRIGEADQERLTALRHALDGIDAEETATRARLLTLTATEQIYTTTLEHRLAIVTEAVGLARSSGDRGALADSLLRAVQAVVAPATLSTRLAWLQEAAVLAEESGDPFQRFLTCHLLSRCDLESADRNGFEAQLATKGTILEELPHAGLRWTHAYDLAVQSLLAGDLAEAEQRATDALNFGLETEESDAFTIYGSQLLNIRVRQGRIAELISLIEQTVAAMPGQPVYQAVLAMAYADGGDLARCGRLLDAAHEEGFAIPPDNSWSSALYCWADAAVRTGDGAAAMVLHDRLAPFGDHLVTTHVTVDPVIAHTLGRLEHVLGRYDEAAESFGRALELHERLRCPPFVATTEVAWAQLLTDRDGGGDRHQARAMAERARQTAVTRGYAGIELDAVALLARIA
jgi:class 3 adenylate cyclase/tetratricopeptide (TPR) repeat protein